MKELKRFYKENADFREYVDRFVKSRKSSVDEVLSLVVTQEYAQYVKEANADKCKSEANRITKTVIPVACGVDES